MLSFLVSIVDRDIVRTNACVIYIAFPQGAIATSVCLFFKILHIEVFSNDNGAAETRLALPMAVPSCSSY